jgi:HD-GYP domain-containing protein (c-di-GMP phosphodiesterase class II)
MSMLDELPAHERLIIDELRSRCDLVAAALFLCDAHAREPLNDAARAVDGQPLAQYVSTAFPLSGDRSLNITVPREQAGVLTLVTKSFRDMQRLSDCELTISQFGDRLTDAYEQVQLLFRLARLLNHVDNPQDIMQAVCGQIRQVTRFAWLGAMFDSDPLVVAPFRDKLYIDGKTPGAPETFRSLVGELLQGGTPDDWTRILLPRENRLAASSGAEAVAEPISMNGRVIATLVAGGKSADDPDIDSFDTQLLDATADFLGIFHQNLARFQEQRDLFLGTLHALTSAIDAKDHYTRGHSERVSQWAQRIARRIGLDEKVVETYRIAGLVHDTGKIGVPETVLLKPGRLTDAEFDQLRRHPQIGYDILSGIAPLADVLPGVLHHHERWDGKGYPHGLKGEAIPQVARILALADTYDAMTSTRSYRAALPMDKVLSEIRDNAGTQFDPALAPVLLELIQEDLAAGVVTTRAVAA